MMIWRLWLRPAGGPGAQFIESQAAAAFTTTKH